MGSALARALVKANHEVTVWNRTHERALPLEQAGAHVTNDLTVAVSASDVVITSVASTAVVDALVEQAAEQLRGRTLVQLSTGRPSEIRRGAAAAASAGVTYIGGAILAYPRAVGTDEAMFLIGGDRPAFEHVRPLLDDLGTVRFLAEDPAAPSAMDAAQIAFFYGAMSGLLHGARLTVAANLALDDYRDLSLWLVQNFVAGAVADATERFVSRDYSQPQSSLDAHLGGIADLVVGTTDEAGLRSNVMEAIRDEILSAVDAGLGGQDIAALLER